MLQIAEVFASAIALRLTGVRSAGRRLLQAARSDDETTRAVAATLLARAGRRACPTLRDAARREEGLPLVLALLGDLGDASDEELLAHFTRHPDAQVQVAAKDALEVLQARRPS